LEEEAKVIADGEDLLLFGVAYPKGKAFKSGVGRLVLTPNRLIYIAPAFASTVHAQGSPLERKEILLRNIQNVSVRKARIFDRCTMLSYADSVVLDLGDQGRLRFHVLDAQEWPKAIDFARASSA
jgi:hypothetical protein